MATLSQVALLEMAREVLQVCQDDEYDLQDIIADLTMSKSTEITINRIFDGQVNERYKRESINCSLMELIILTQLLSGFCR